MDIQPALQLAELCLRFARVERATRHPDGVRPETDSDHTVMLCVVACAWAEKYAPHLDLGLISQYASVHDLVEAYSGDVNTYGATAADLSAKSYYECESLDRIRAQFATLPWVARTIERYNSLADEESRFVKIVDKCLVRLTHLLTGGTVVGGRSYPTHQVRDARRSAHEHHLRQRALAAREYPQKQGLELMDALDDECAMVWGIP